jgi:hypothetical protein
VGAATFLESEVEMKLNGNFYTKKELMQKLDCTKQQFETIKDKTSFINPIRVGQVDLFTDEDYLKLSQAKSLVRGYGV